MRATGASRLLVVENDRLVGIVSLKDLLRFLDLKLQLEGFGNEPRHLSRPPSPLLLAAGHRQPWPKSTRPFRTSS